MQVIRFTGCISVEGKFFYQFVLTSFSQGIVFCTLGEVRDKTLEIIDKALVLKRVID